MSGLPEGWAKAPLGQVARLISGSGFPEAMQNRKGLAYPFFKVGDLGKVERGQKLLHSNHSVDDSMARSLRATRIPSNSVLFAKIGMAIRLNRRRLNGVPCCIDNNLMAAIPSEAVLPEFLLRFLETMDFMPLTQATTVPALRKSDLEMLTVPVPPLNEQHRIVPKLEELLAKAHACQKRLAKIPVILKRFRQSVLAAACSGQLTTEWRERNAVVESGLDLLNRIKEQRLLAAQTAKEKNQILEAFEQQAFRFSDVENDFDDIPETWVGCLVGQVGTVCNGSTPSRKRAEYWNGVIPWISSGEVRNNLIRATRERISQLGYENSSVRMLPKGSVLLAMIGEGKTRGQSAILEIEATINQNIAAVTLEHGLVSSEYLWRWFQLQYESTRQQGGGSGPQALNCERVRELPFVLAPTLEQHEIVRRIEVLFAFADQTEERYKKAQAQIDKLTQSILAKAFRGELVPTETELARRKHCEPDPA